MGQAPVGVAVLSSGLEFLYVNEALAAINGRSVAEHVGRTPREALGPNSDAWLRFVRAALEDGVVVGPVRVVAPARHTSARLRGDVLASRRL